MPETAGGLGGYAARAPRIVLVFSLAVLGALAASGAPVDASLLRLAEAPGIAVAAGLAALAAVTVLTRLFSLSLRWRFGVALVAFAAAWGVSAFGWNAPYGLRPLASWAAFVLGLFALLAGVIGPRHKPYLWLVFVPGLAAMSVSLIGYGDFTAVLAHPLAPPWMALVLAAAVVNSVFAADMFARLYADGRGKAHAAGTAANVTLLRASASGLALFGLGGLLMAFDGGAGALSSLLFFVGAALAGLVAAGCAAPAFFALGGYGEKFIEAENLRARTAEKSLRRASRFFTFRLGAALFAISGILSVLAAFEAPRRYPGEAVDLGVFYILAAFVVLLALRSVRSAVAVVAALIGADAVAAMTPPYASLEGGLAEARFAGLAATFLTLIAAMWHTADWRQNLRGAVKGSDAARRALENASASFLVAAGLAGLLAVAFETAGLWSLASAVALEAALQMAVALVIGAAAHLTLGAAGGSA